jgi:hypothetical protein
VKSAKILFAKLSDERKLSGAASTPLNTKRCRWSNNDKERSARNFAGLAESKEFANRLSHQLIWKKCKTPRT